MSTIRDYYEILEINEKASQEVVRMAYKALALKFHPDKFQGDTIFANDQMQKINEAYDVISNPIRRSVYDDSLRKLREEEKSLISIEKIWIKREMKKKSIQVERKPEVVIYMIMNLKEIQKM